MAKDKETAIIVQLTQDALALPTEIKTEEDAFLATDILLKVRRRFTEIDGRRKERTAPANETIKLINDDYKEALGPLKGAEDKLKEALEGYVNGRIVADIARLAELRDETGDKSLVMPIGLKNIPSAEGEVRFRRTFAIRITDEKRVPKKYKGIDLKAIQKEVDLMDGDVKIPGVEIIPTASAAIYTN